MDFLESVVSELNREGSYFFSEVLLGLLIKCSAQMRDCIAVVIDITVQIFCNFCFLQPLPEEYFKI